MSRNPNRYPGNADGFESTEFSELLNDVYSYRVEYQPAHLCPCDDERRSGNPDPVCPSCHGVGFYWEAVALPAPDVITREFYFGSETVPTKLPDANAILSSVTSARGITYPDAHLDALGNIVFPTTTPHDGELLTVTYTAPMQIRMHAQNIKTSQAWVDRGIIQPGDLQTSLDFFLPDLTTPNPAWDAAEYDKFILTDVVKRRNQDMRKSKKERLEQPNYTEVISCKSYNKTTSSFTSYEFGTDFNIVNDKIVWVTGRPQPAPDQRYTLEYKAKPVYYVFNDMLRVRHIDGQNNPRSIGLRQFESFPGRGK